MARARHVIGDMPGTEPILLPYRVFDLETREFGTAVREFDGAHAVAQIRGVMECACEVLNQLHVATPSEHPGGIQRIATTKPIDTALDARFGPARDDGKVSGSVATIAFDAVKRLFDGAAPLDSGEVAAVSGHTGPTWIGSFVVEAPRVRLRLREAAQGHRPAEASVGAWYDVCLASYHGSDWWPFHEFIGWYLAQNRRGDR